jgi:hypothetical protein
VQHALSRDPKRVPQQQYTWRTSGTGAANSHVGTTVANLPQDLIRSTRALWPDEAFPGASSGSFFEDTRYVCRNARSERLRISRQSPLEEIMGRGILLWMLGVPIPIILLLAMCQH